jgi:hypothetical protein
MNKHSTNKEMDASMKREINKIVRKKLSKAVLAEEKIFYGTNSGSSISSTPSFTQLNPIPQGVTDANRVGDTVRLLRLRLKGIIVLASGASASSYNNMRIQIFTFKSTSGLVSSSLFPSAFVGSANAPFAPQNHDYEQLLKIHWDRLVRVNYSHFTETFEIDIKIPSSHAICQFTAGSSTVCTNALYIALTSDDAISPYPQAVFSYSLTYGDS